MASSSITSWEIDGKTVETVRGFILGLQNHCRWWHSHEIKRHLFLGRKAMTNLDGILKSRDITANKGLSSQSYDFSSSSVRMWELDHKEGWAPKNWCFQTEVLEKTLESLWLARRSNWSILKEINSQHSLEGLMLKLQYLVTWCEEPALWKRS